MATTQNTYTGNGSTTNYSFTFPYFAETDVKVRLNGVTQATSTYSFANATTISMNSAPGNGVAINIFRDTNNDSKQATFYPGSAIKAEDLNNNFDQILYVVQEVDNNALDVFGSNTMQANLNIGGYKLINVADPTSAQDAVTKAYLERTGSITSTQILDATIVNADVNASAAIAGTKISPDFGSQNIATSGTVDGRDVSTDGIKLDSIETGATADQNAAEIRTLVESASDSNVFTDADHSKLNAIEASATADQTNAEIRAAVEAASDSNVFTDADHTKLNAIEASATADQTDAEIRTAVEAATDSNVFTDADHSKLNAIEASATADQTAGEIKTLLQSDKITSSEIATGTLDGRYYTETESDARYFNVSTGDTIKDGDTFPDNDTTIATTAAINDRIIDLVDDVGGFVPIANETSFPNANPDVNNGAGTLVSIKALSSNLTSNGSGVATISNGTVGNSTVTITGLANSTTYASTFGMIVETTSTLNTYTFHRQVPIATEVSTVAGSISNVNTVAGSISNVNTVAGNNSNITTVAGVSSNVTTVAGVASNVTTVAGISSDVTAVAGDATDIGAVAAKATEIGRLGTADAVSDLNTLGTTAIVSDLDTCATNVSNINTVGGSISNVNIVATNISDVNDFSDKYRVASSAPSSNNDAGDLYFDTSSNELRVYNGSSWQGGVTATGNLAGLGANTFTGNQSLGDNKKIIFGTGGDLEIYFDGSNSYIKEPASVAGQLILQGWNGTDIRQGATGEHMIRAIGGGQVELYYDNSKKFATKSNGAFVHGDANGAYLVLADTSSNYCYQLIGFDANASAAGGRLVLADADGGTVLDMRQAGNNIFCKNNFNLNVDNLKLQLGAGDDLQIYHDGTLSTIKNTHANGIAVRSNVILLQSAAGDHDYLATANEAGVSLFYDNSKKLETTSSGAKVTGTLEVTEDFVTTMASGYDFWIDRSGNKIQAGDNIKFQCGNSGDLQIHHNGSHSYIVQNGTGNLYIDAEGTDEDLYLRANRTVYIQASGTENGIKVLGDGAVELYYDNSKKFETNSDGVKTYGDHFFVGTNGNAIWDKSADKFFHGDNVKDAYGNADDLQIYHTGSQSFLKNTTGGLFIDNIANISLRVADGGEDGVQINANGAVELYYDNSKKLETTSAGVDITGILNVSNYIGLDDSVWLYCGTGNDLAVGHDGSNARIVNTVGNIRLEAKSGELGINIIPDGATELYHNNVKKFETTSSGINVTGDLTVNGSAFASGNTFTAVANGSIANNKAVKLDTDGKVSEIKESLQNRSTPAGVVSGGQAFPTNDANSSGGNIRGSRKSTVIYDSDTGRIIIIWGDNGYLKSRVGTPNKTTGAVTWGNVISINSSDNFKEMSAVYDTTADKVILFVAKDNSPARLEGYVGTVASSGNSVTWSSAVSPGNGEIRYISSAFDSTTGRTIVCFKDVSSGGLKFEICYINSGTLTWHTGDTANSNMITTDMFGSAVSTNHFDVCSVDSSKWLFCTTMESSSPPSGFTQYALYAKIINASTNTTAAPTYANAGAKHIETSGSTQRGTVPSVAWDPTLEKIMYTWTANSSGSDTSSNSFGMLCYFDAGKTDITINNATYNVGGSGNTSDLHQLSYDSGSGRFIFTIEDYGGVRGSFLTCGGTGNNTLTVSGRGTVVSPNPDNFGSDNKHDLIDITGGYMFSFYGNQLASSSASDRTITSIIATQETTSNLTSGHHYVGYADQAYTNAQTATIKTYGNIVTTLTSLTPATNYFVQGDGTVAATADSTLSGALGADVPIAGIALTSSTLLIRDPWILK